MTFGQFILGLLSIVSVVLPYILPAKGPKGQGGPRLGDQKVTSAAYGSYININYGTSRVSGNLLWFGGIVEVKTVTGGGLFGPPKQTSYTYFSSFSVGVAEGPLGGIVKVFFDGKLVHDRSGTGRFSKKDHDLRFYNGDELQAPAAIISDVEGADTPGFRGIAHIVVDTLPLLLYGNRIPNFTGILGQVLDSYLQNNFDRGGVVGGEALPIQHWVVDHRRKFVYSIWNQDRIEKFDLLSGSTVYSKTLIAPNDSDFNGLNVLYGRALVLMDNGNLVGCGTDSGGKRVVYKINPISGKITESLKLDTTGNIGLLNVTTTQSPYAPDVVKIPGLSLPEMWVLMSNRELHMGVLENMENLGKFPNAAPISITGTSFLLYATAVDDASQAVIWVLVFGGGRLGLFKVNKARSRSGLGDELLDILWEIKKFDLTGDGGEASGWEDANSTGILFGNGGGEIPVMQYVGEDNTLLIIAATGDVDTWKIGKFDVGSEEMVEILGREDYETGTSDHEFTIEPLMDEDHLFGNVRDTFQNCTVNVTDARGLGRLQKWWAVQPNGKALAWSPVTMRLRAPGKEIDFANFDRTYFAAASKFVQIIDRNSLFIDLSVVDTPATQPSEIFLERVAPKPDPLDEVVADMCRRAGMKDHQFDVTALAGNLVQGYVVNQRAAVKENLSVLMLVYDFTFTESDWKIVFVKRGGANSFTIPERDLGVGEDKGEDEVLQITNAAEREQVMGLQVRYIDAARDYQENVASFQRILEPVNVVSFNSHDNVDIPVTLTPAEAAEVVKRSLGRIWAERIQMETKLPPKYLGMDPTDNVSITADGETRIVRVLDANVGANRLIETKAAIEDSALLSIDVTGIGGLAAVQNLDDVAYSELITLDTSILKDEDDPGSGTYLVYSGFKYSRATGFPGATAYIADASNAENFEAYISRGSDEDLEWGQTISKLNHVGSDFNAGFGSTQSLDVTNTVTVFMVKGTLTSATSDEDFYDSNAVSGGVKIMIGGEVVQAKTVVDNGGGEYVLSNLLRGRRGTEWAVTEHFIGEEVVILKRTLPFTLTEFGAELVTTGTVSLWSKTVTQGLQFDDAFFKEHIFVGNSLRPYSPTDIHGIRDGSNNLDVRWIRRNRFNGEVGWGDGQEGEIMNSEASEEYRVVLLNQGTFDPTLPDAAWSENLIKTVVDAQVVNTADFKVVDNGDGTVTITDNDGVVDFTDYNVNSWLELSNFDDDDMNTFAVVKSRSSLFPFGILVSTMDLYIQDPGTDASNTDAVIRQIPTNTQFTVAEITAAGYNTTEPVDVIVYQWSSVVGRGRSGFDQIGLDR